MRIDKMHVQNFRNFKDLEISFDPGMNLIIGNNGSGKSALLSATLISASSILSGIAYASSRGIRSEEVRHETREEGGVYNRVDCFPVIIESSGVIDGKTCSWTRSLTGVKSKTSGDIKELKNLSKEMEAKVIRGENIVIPLVAYYGTGRLWAQKKTKREGAQRLQSRFVGFEDSIEEMSSDKQLREWFYDMSLQEAQEGKLSQLDAVRAAMEACFAGIVNHKERDGVKVSYRQKLREIVVEYLNQRGEYEIHPISEMSDGYKTTLNMVADIAHRMAILNPGLKERILETPGVVIIDEIELHLHPGWQGRILNDLSAVFPKVQFIVSTHSPAVISSCKKGKLFMLRNDGGVELESVYGKDVNSVLRAVMEVEERPVEIANLLNDFAGCLARDDDKGAESVLAKLKALLGEDNTVVQEAELDLSINRMNWE